MSESKTIGGRQRGYKSDLGFYRKRIDRTYRLRLPYPGEISAYFDGHKAPALSGDEKWFVISRFIDGIGIVSGPVSGPKEADPTDYGDDFISVLFAFYFRTAKGIEIIDRDDRS